MLRMKTSSKASSSLGLGVEWALVVTNVAGLTAICLMPDSKSAGATAVGAICELCGSQATKCGEEIGAMNQSTSIVNKRMLGKK